MEVSEEASLGLPTHLAGRNEDTDKGEVGKKPRPRTNSLAGNPGTKKEMYRESMMHLWYDLTNSLEKSLV